MSGSGVLDVAGNIQDGNAAVYLILSGTGILNVLGNNTYSGGTTVLNGLFAVTTPSAVPDGTSLTVGSGGTFVFDPTLPTLPPVSGKTPVPTSPGQGRNSHGGDGLAPNPPVKPAPPIDAAPVVTSVTCVGPSLVDADSVQFIIAFSKPVTGLSPNDFAVSGRGELRAPSRRSAARILPIR